MDSLMFETIIPQKRKDLIFLTGVLLITAALYCTNLPEGFINYDDPTYITQNQGIRSVTPQNILRFITEPYFANYHPLTMFSYMLDYQLWGLNSKGYHIHNLILHLGCIVVVYLIFKSLEMKAGIVWFVVSLFALHPTNAESVLWASERKNLLAALFFLLSFLLYIRHHSSRFRLYYLLSIFFYLLSLLSKASAVTAVAIFLSYDYFIEGRQFKALKLYDKIPFLALAEISAFWTIHAAQTGHTLTTYHRQGTGISLLAVPKIVGEYVGLLLFPNNVNVLYIEHAKYSWTSMSLWLPFFITIGIIFLFWNSHRSVFFWLVFFLILLLPVLNLVPLPVKMANRYLYLPQIGFWVILGIWADRMLLNLKDRVRLKKAFCLGLCCWFIFLINQTLDVAKIWKNSYTLWEDSLKKDFRNALAHVNMADFFLTHLNQPNRAATHNLLALKFSSHSALACYNLGVYFMQNKKWESSKEYLNKAIAIEPEDDDATNALGAVYFMEGKLPHALLMFCRSVWINPKNQQAWDNIFHVYAKMGYWKEAKETALQMTLIFPELPIGRQRLSECP